MAHFNWLVDKGVPFKNSEYKQRAMMALTDDCLLFTGSEQAWPFPARPNPVPAVTIWQWRGDNGGPLFMKIMADNVAKRNIAVHYEARALRLIVDDTGPEPKVCGLVVRINMEEQHILARRGVVLCTGGFVMNEKMVKKYAPALQRCTAPIGNPGDSGLRHSDGPGCRCRRYQYARRFCQPAFLPASLADFRRTGE